MRYKSNRFHFCGGTIIKGNRVLTAAHCTNGQSASQLNVAGGQLRKNSDTDDGYEQIISVSSMLVFAIFHLIDIKTRIAIAYIIYLSPWNTDWNQISIGLLLLLLDLQNS